jgi:ATP-dependent DNA helicase DinG
MRSTDLLGASGPFAEAFPDFKVRGQQIEMTNAVELAIANSDHLIIEAGTGTGKTLAYLVPAILSGMKIVISTGTRNLQDQLFNKDLPGIGGILGLPFRSALLKGRSNYICPQRLEVFADSGQESSSQILNDLVAIQYWWTQSATGDISELDSVSESSPVWPRVTSTVDNCFGQNCPKFDRCPVYKARAKAQQADIIIVNHHLLFADLMLKEEGAGELLPDADVIVVDEAHQIPDIASLFFSSSLSSWQLLDLCRDVMSEQLLLGADDKRVDAAIAGLTESVRFLIVSFANESGSRSWSELQTIADINDAIAKVDIHLSNTWELLQSIKERSRGLENCCNRMEKLLDRFTLLTEPVGGEGYIHWVEASSRGFVINLSPLDVSQQFSTLMEGLGSTWIFTSATLSVAESFEHFQLQLGIEHQQTIRLESPYRFDEQVRFFVPEQLPDPSHSDYTSSLVKEVRPIIKANNGGTFFLFTSYRALTEAAEIFARETDFDCLVQGSMPRTELLERFRKKRSVLLGTSSFWEGVDVKGDLLTCVIIDKLPFMSPGDPVVKARLEYLSANGINGFFNYQLPEAVLSLKQGFGRLIRDTDDKGLFVLGDPRVLSKSYGRYFLKSLPSMPMMRDNLESATYLSSLVSESK